MSELPTGTVTFLFTDIEGSTQLWEEQRTVRATLRFGDRDVIIQRARQEERLSRAA